MAETALEAIPQHVGLILDGNRRWAVQQGMKPFEGHRQGYQVLRTIARHALERGVRCVSAYVFSTENWKRSEEEVSFLMDLFVWIATKEVDDYLRDGIKIVFLGSRDRLSRRVIQAMESAEQKTRSGTKMVMALCLNYGGQLELAEAVQRIIAAGVPAEAVTPDTISQYVYHPDVPPVDLVIRTSGEQRLSNFMMWRVAYAELLFTDQPWPAFTITDFDAALDEYARRQRRFGR